MLELGALPLQRRGERPVAPGGDVADRVQPQRPRAARARSTTAPRRRVEIGEVRAHRREVELGPPRGRVGLDAAVRDREAAPVRHQPHLVRAGAAGRHLADPPVAVVGVPDAEPAGALGDRVLGGEEQAAVRREGAVAVEVPVRRASAAAPPPRPSAQSMTSAKVPGRRAKATASGRAGCAAAAWPRSGSGRRKHSTPVAGQPDQAEAAVGQPGRREVVGRAGRGPAELRHQAGAADPGGAAQEGPAGRAGHGQSPSIELKPLRHADRRADMLGDLVLHAGGPRSAAPRPGTGPGSSPPPRRSARRRARPRPAPRRRLASTRRRVVRADRRGEDRRRVGAQRLRARPRRCAASGPERQASARRGCGRVEGAERPAEAQVVRRLQRLGQRGVERARRSRRGRDRPGCPAPRRWSGSRPRGRASGRASAPRSPARSRGDRHQQAAAVAAGLDRRGRRVEEQVVEREEAARRDRDRRRRPPGRRPPGPRPRPSPRACAGSSPWCRARRRARSRRCPPRAGPKRRCSTAIQASKAPS